MKFAIDVQYNHACSLDHTVIRNICMPTYGTYVAKV